MTTFHLKPLIQYVICGDPIEAVVWSGPNLEFTSCRPDPDDSLDPSLKVEQPAWLTGETRVDDDLLFDVFGVQMTARPGDWIVKGYSDRPYPVSAELFAAMFDPD